MKGKLEYLFSKFRVLVVIMSMLSLLACGESMEMEKVITDPNLRLLVNAAKDDNENKVIQLIDQGVNPNAKGVKGVTALHWLMYKNDLTGMELLLKHGASPNLMMKKGEIKNVLEVAAGKGKEKALLLMLRYGGDADYKGYYKRLVEHAIAYRQRKIIKILIAHGADVVNDHARGVFSAIDYASSYRFYDLVELFIENGADPLHVDAYGNTFVDNFQKNRSDSNSYKRIHQLLESSGVKFPIPRTPQTGVGTIGKNLKDPDVQAWVAEETIRVKKHFNIYMRIIGYYLGKKHTDLELPLYPQYKSYADVNKADLFRKEYKKNVVNYYLEAAKILDVVEPEWRNNKPYLPPKRYIQ